MVVGVECKNSGDAEKLYNRLGNKYQVEPNYQDDYLVDLYHDEDLVSTFATTKDFANEIDNLYFKKTS